ncbi:ATP-binding protein [Mycobacteroides abscessus subsp. abscessus]|uniref:ATP-binding protein n=1 Tax=Mycobacteroides abscessus TaxID=36809 RepID=UPI00092B3328|nr:ATP-binding protein [Mycobacteroides abscessus]MDO2986850.1 ATP-binding protein [Mycobacteroides abscessus subsp. abscessus]MDO3208872.1 ATP-binding protein [Mycobacteroides abscessus subsp. massiliense]SID35597.1 Type IV secretory pathway, VirB4 components [Mycobacteroides abscessus subsp. abscessus]SIJ96544.1 Type IV secretory pathway, VirB4 components [Mycobacteroides abscessus subsp. abscessus]SKT92661.1 Type IV secretory pathway, VirB4 components [Mycobacteroides abscessus subsp. massi
MTAIADFSAPARGLQQRLRTNTLQPTIATAGNLRYTRANSWWADYIVEGKDWGLRDLGDKEQVRYEHQLLFQEIPDYSLLGGFSVPLDLAEQMRLTINPDSWARGNPDYIEECNAQADRLDLLAPRTRLYWLSMPLDQKFRQGLLLADLNGDQQPTAEDVEAAADRAAKLEDSLANIITLKPVTGFQMRWLWDHHISRGIGAGPCPPATEGRIRAGLRSFTQAMLDEGANADRAKSSWFQRRKPSFEPVVKISQPDQDDPRVTYQRMLTVKSFPTEEMIFPGGTEFLATADTVTGRGDTAIVDWVMRIRQVPRHEVLARNVKTLRQIDEQMDQRDGETGFGHNMLAEKADMLARYHKRIEGADDEVEIRFTPIFAVGAATKEDAENAATELKRACKSMKIILAEQIGAQKELWMSMVPGSHHRRAIDTCVHITPSEDAAGFVPFTSASVGDDRGPIIGINLTSGGFEPVRLNIVAKSSQEEAASVATVGQPGGGKTHCLQTLGTQAVDEGGQVMAIDRTEVGEYAEWARGLTNPKIIDPTQPEYSMDPLVVFDRYEAADRTLDLLLPLINVGTTSPAAAQLKLILEPNSRDDNEIHCLADLNYFLASEHLPAEYRTSEIKAVSDMLNFWASNQNGDVLFKKNLPPMELTADITVVRTHRLQLPTEEEVSSPHLYKEINPTKHFGRAIYNLTATIGRRAFFANKYRFGGLISDEAHHLTQTQGGAQVVTEFALDGRKHNAACFLGSQSPDHYRELTEFFTTLITFRQAKENQARKSIQFLGLDPDAHPDLVKALRFQTSPPGKDGSRPPVHRRGEGYIRDHLGRVARFKALGPALERRASRMNTNVPLRGAAA